MVMLTQQRIAGVELRLAEVDREIAALRESGYGVERDVLLEQRLSLMRYLRELRAGLVPNG